MRQVTGDVVAKKEMENAYKLLDIYQKQNKKLQTKLYEDGNSIETILKLQSVVRQKDTTIDQLRQQLKTLEKIKRTQQSALGNYNDDQNYKSKIAEYKLQITGLRNRIRELEKERDRTDRNFRKQHEFCVSLDEAYRELCKKVSSQP